jgi:glucose/arabinose dehydrogenase
MRFSMTHLATSALGGVLVTALLLGCALVDAREAVPRAGGEDGALVETVVGGLDVPWEIAFLPDGRALVSERPGRVRLLERNGRLRQQPVGEIRVQAEAEGGLLGVAVDPEFESNSFVYLYRTTEDGNEVVRFRFENEYLKQDAVVVEGIRAKRNHHGGRIHFGPDGLLYISAGDGLISASAQDPDSLNGKILRTGAFRGDGERPEIVSLGHRNPQGFDWQPGTGRLLAVEHGPDSHDELNLIRPGANYGWPEARGQQDSGPGLEPPLIDYASTIAPSGGTFVSRPGSAWTGSFIFGCLRGQQIRRVALDGARVTADEALFEGRFGRVRTVVEGPDGALYALTNNTDGRGAPREGDDQILRIVPPPA